MCVWTYRCACRHTGAGVDAGTGVSGGADVDADVSAQTGPCCRHTGTGDPDKQTTDAGEQTQEPAQHTGDTHTGAHVYSDLPPATISAQREENRVPTSPEPSKSLLHLMLPV